jgi:monovalent cation/proton antiporter MnhG/PhaG subunit
MNDEAIAAALILLGAVVTLIAAIGVARLPDAFLRMHAATKAGVVGAGFMLLGAGFAFDSAEAWLRVGLIIVFLLVTVPIASHALGRAAYVGGAPMWGATALDELQGVLPRAKVDAEPMARSRVSRGGVLPAGAALSPPPTRRVLLALAQGPGSEGALRDALALVANPQTEVTLLSLLCAPSLANTGPFPMGGAFHAKRMVERRMAGAREASASLVHRLEAGCGEMGLAFRTRHEEGDARALLARAAAHHDLTVLPQGAWFDHAQVLPEGEAAARAARVNLRGTLFAVAGMEAPRALHFLHEGDEASGESLRHFLTLGLFAEAPLTITPLDRPGARAAAEESVALARSHGRQVRLGEPALPPDDPAPIAEFSGPVLALLPAMPDAPSRAWRSLREMAHPVLLV